ncbi:MAG: GNAT family N-acetyltransferase [Trebonia sp.]
MVASLDKTVIQAQQLRPPTSSAGLRPVGVTHAAMPIEFRNALVDRGDGAVLEAAMRAEVADVCGGIDPSDPRMPAAGARELGPPRGAFVVGYANSGPICCGGIKGLDEQACEIKRMYVVPPARGHGVARLLLTELERRAWQLG